jgi:hypothetical protein
MVISVALAREQARLVIKGAESCERRWGNQPGNLPVGLVGVVAGASVDSMGPSSAAVRCNAVLSVASRFLETTFG